MVGEKGQEQAKAFDQFNRKYFEFNTLNNTEAERLPGHLSVTQSLSMLFNQNFEE